MVVVYVSVGVVCAACGYFLAKFLIKRYEKKLAEKVEKQYKELDLSQFEWMTPRNTWFSGNHQTNEDTGDKERGFVEEDLKTWESSLTDGRRNASEGRDRTSEEKTDRKTIAKSKTKKPETKTDSTKKRNIWRTKRKGSGKKRTGKR